MNILLNWTQRNCFRIFFIFQQSFEFHLVVSSVLIFWLKWIQAKSIKINLILDRFNFLLRKSPFFLFIFTLIRQWFEQYQWFPDSWIKFGQAILNRNLNWIIFWKNSNSELNQIGYRTGLAQSDIPDEGDNCNLALSTRLANWQSPRPLYLYLELDLSNFGFPGLKEYSTINTISCGLSCWLSCRLVWPIGDHLGLCVWIWN